MENSKKYVQCQASEGRLYYLELYQFFDRMDIFSQRPFLKYEFETFRSLFNLNRAFHISVKVLSFMAHNLIPC